MSNEDAQLPQRSPATLHVLGNFAKSLNVI